MRDPVILNPGAVVDHPAPVHPLAAALAAAITDRGLLEAAQAVAHQSLRDLNGAPLKQALRLARVLADLHYTFEDTP